MSKGKPTIQRWYEERGTAKKAAVKEGYASFFRIEITKGSHAGETKFFVGLFLPVDIKRGMKSGRAKVTEQPASATP
jgi:hypothetical protein